MVNGYVNAWQSIEGAVSVGNAEVGLTRQITGVAAGTEDTDVVNVAQLKKLAGNVSEQMTGLDTRITTNTENIKKNTEDIKTNTENIKTNTENIKTNTENIKTNTENIKTNTENIAVLNGRVDRLDTRVDRVGAGAAALAGLHPLDYDPENKWDFAAGYGNYNGANAVAIGAFYRPDENKIISIGGSFGGGENMISAGISVKVGQGTGISTSKAAMANEIRELKARDREREAQMQEIMRQLEILQKQAGK